MEPSVEEELNTVRKQKWEKIIEPLVNKYSSAVEKRSESIFDEDNRSASTEAVFEKPFEGKFDFIKHYDLLWVRDIYQRL